MATMPSPTELEVYWIRGLELKLGWPSKSRSLLGRYLAFPQIPPRPSALQSPQASRWAVMWYLEPMSTAERVWSPLMKTRKRTTKLRIAERLP